jgi:hypothetical protein
MKPLRLLFIVMTCPAIAMAQGWELGSDFNFSQPVGGMTRTMNNAVGVNFKLARHFNAPFAVGAEIGFGTYGSSSSRQQYTFDDGSVTETDVVVSNNIFNFNLGARYFFRNGKRINPYLSGKVGITSFSTTLTIEDPDDQFSCHPLESDILSRDNTFTTSGGAGVQIDFSTFFRKMEPQRFFFDFNIMTTQGGNIKYMNSTLDPSQSVPDEDVMTKFLNTQTNVVHEHHVGYVYSSVLSMMEYRFGVAFRPGWK